MLENLLVGMGSSAPQIHTLDIGIGSRNLKDVVSGEWKGRQLCLKGNWERFGSWESSSDATGKMSTAAVQAKAKGGGISRERSSHD